jgi:hypothetical protein
MRRNRFVLGLLIGLAGGLRVLRQKPQSREESAQDEAANVVRLDTYRRKSEAPKHAAEDGPLIDGSDPAQRDAIRLARAGVDSRLRDAMKKTKPGPS